MRHSSFRIGLLRDLLPRDLRPNPTSLTGGKVDSGIGLMVDSATGVAHGKYVGVDSGVDIQWAHKV